MDSQAELSLVRFIRAMSDPHLLGNPRVLMNLLAHERRQRAEDLERFCLQSDITLEMWKELANWMLKVCELQNCEEEVFPLAMSYVRICLTLFPVRRDCLRLLGSTCLLLASKMKNSVPLSITALEHYTGYTVTCHKIREWEKIILKKMRWDLTVIIPHDFLEHILERVHCTEDIRTSLHKCAGAYLTRCACECSLSKFAPSTIAVVCIAKALWDSGFVIPPCDDLYICLSALAGISTDEFLACKVEVERALYVNNLGDHTYVNPSLD